MNRDTKIGELARLKRERMRMQVKIDGAVKAFLYHIDPMDDDLAYVRKIDIVKVEIWIDDVVKYKKEFDRLEKRIQELAEELGESGD